MHRMPEGDKTLLVLDPKGLCLSSGPALCVDHFVKPQVHRG